MTNPPTQLLDAELDLLREHAEAWVKDHENAMACREIEDLLALALETLERIRKRCDAYNAATGNVTAAEGQILLNYWRRWHEIAVLAMEQVAWIESHGYHPDKAEAFRFAVNEASIATHWEKVGEARRQIAHGRTRTLEEMENGLSHNAG